MMKQVRDTIWGFTLIEPQQVFLSFRRLLIPSNSAGRQTFRKSGKQRGCQGFTLIELLVTITIIGLLTSIGILSYQSTNRKARDGKRQVDLEQIRTALEIYRSDLARYPANLDELTTGSYIQSIPEDPKEPQFVYFYAPSIDLRSYELCAHIEQGGGVQDYCGGTMKCVGVCNYRVENP